MAENNKVVGSGAWLFDNCLSLSKIATPPSQDPEQAQPDYQRNQ